MKKITIKKYLIILMFNMIGILPFIYKSNITYAEIIGFEGIVTSVSIIDGGTDPQLFSVGDNLQGQYTFDENNIIVQADGYGYLIYDLSFTIGGHNGSSPASVSAYKNNSLLSVPPSFDANAGSTPPFADTPRDVYHFFSRQESGLILDGLGDYYLIDFDINLEDFTGTAIPPQGENSYLVDPVVLENFQTNQFRLSLCAGWCPGDHYVIGGTITSFSYENLEVAIDIKPQSCPNPLNVKSKGVLPVAILGTADLDVTDIDIASLRLNGVAPVKSEFEDVTAPAFKIDPCDCEELDEDSFEDLVLKFNKQEIITELGAVLNDETIELTLTGELTDGTEIEGIDCVVIRGVQ